MNIKLYILQPTRDPNYKSLLKRFLINNLGNSYFVPLNIADNIHSECIGEFTKEYVLELKDANFTDICIYTENNIVSIALRTMLCNKEIDNLEIIVLELINFEIKVVTQVQALENGKMSGTLSVFGNLLKATSNLRTIQLDNNKNYD